MHFSRHARRSEFRLRFGALSHVFPALSRPTAKNVCGRAFRVWRDTPCPLVAERQGAFGMARHGAAYPGTALPTGLNNDFFEPLINVIDKPKERISEKTTAASRTATNHASRGIPEHKANAGSRHLDRAGRNGITAAASVKSAASVTEVTEVTEVMAATANAGVVARMRVEPLVKSRRVALYPKYNP